jgi:hypothetical protein
MKRENSETRSLEDIQSLARWIYNASQKFLLFPVHYPEVGVAPNSLFAYLRKYQQGQLPIPLIHQILVFQCPTTGRGGNFHLLVIDTGFYSDYFNQVCLIKDYREQFKIFLRDFLCCDEDNLNWVGKIDAHFLPVSQVPREKWQIRKLLLDQHPKHHYMRRCRYNLWRLNFQPDGYPVGLVDDLLVNVSPSWLASLR